MKKHDLNMLSAWAKDWGIKGFEQYDPQVREKNRQYAIKKSNESKKLNQTVTLQKD